MGLTAIIDADVIKWRVAAAGEKREVEVNHISIDSPIRFNSRTEFWGHHLKKEGGWLAEFNKERTSPILPEEWSLVDIVTPDPIQNVLHSVKLQYESFHKAISASKHKGFVGKGKSFREDRSTILQYKGNRLEAQVPVHLEAVVDYLERRLKCEVVVDIEVDDRVVWEAYRKPSKVVIGVDKDMYGTPVSLFNPDRPDEGIISCDCFGKLYLDGDKVRGYGRLFLYFQVASGDTSDNYSANSASHIKWGAKSAYKALKDCKTDKEAFIKLKEVYQMLYPETKIITGWRGSEITVDWLYCLSENFDLARMLRFDGDDVNVEDVLKRMEIL